MTRWVKKIISRGVYMKNLMNYKGYYGSVEFSDDSIANGKTLNAAVEDAIQNYLG